MVLIFQASVTVLSCQPEWLGEALDKFRCLLSKSWSRLRVIRRLMVKFSANILTSCTHLQGVEGTQALEGIGSYLCNLVIAEVSVKRGKGRVKRQTDITKKVLWPSDPVPSTTGTLATRDRLHSIRSIFCWQAKDIFLGTQSAPTYVAAHRAEPCMDWPRLQLPRAWFLACTACLPNGGVMRWDITKAQGFSLILEHSWTHSTGPWPSVKSKPQWAFFVLWAS